ncbi:ANTAR domain-containing response regulator [Paraburkholderia silvatlantica]|uniref:AmiR/NasT family two-component response regulator n=1 Tax=Paraburkholderia silvatlantica TaxID=321895 RepID=A0ABR6FKJ3_9BURK|nr:ANTAR domain-containing protein [Paraburkholderia silvatlantica]MBB2927881.1 AmiR/NasT family two-component response regulator [Paraburkholderia silvatlantica]PVY27554.1 ANTAR domain-containing protein [Paraburkholderia silvatlantica]PXW34527.1 ANTAR domain-containing protein [Paraburkholderia silvatlantica]
MKKTSLSLRGVKVCAFYCESRDQHNLEQQFRRLGVESTFLATLPDLATLDGYDILMFDSDYASVANHGRELEWPDVPLIAILGTETPSRLLWVINQGVSGVLRKPVRYEGVLSACVLACDNHRTHRALRARIEQLEERVKGRKFVFSAQLMLMRDRGLSEREAFSTLRTLAMNRQISVEQLSVELLSAEGSGRRSAVVSSEMSNKLLP